MITQNRRPRRHEEVSLAVRGTTEIPERISVARLGATCRLPSSQDTSSPHSGHVEPGIWASS